MTNRDEFSAGTKRLLALRASYRCSFRSCMQITVGPSDESSEGHALIGQAAHISAAAPGGKRYLETMSSEERSSIENGIWLCANHATLIDRDDATYTIAQLHEMKREHEAWCKDQLRKQSAASAQFEYLFAVGPDVVCLGELVGVEEAGWSFQIHHFVIGDLGKLVIYVDDFVRCPNVDRYVLSNSTGDGRVLAGAPSLIKNDKGYVVRCSVCPRSPRMLATNLPTDFALSPGDDLTLKNHAIATVSGLEALPQKIRSNLSLQKGESPFHRDFGTRLAEYYRFLRDSPWIEELLKLESIRLAAIPYNDPVQKSQYTPFLCVDRVWSVEVVGELVEDKWLPIRVDLDVHGVGRWEHDLLVCVPDKSAVARRT